MLLSCRTKKSKIIISSWLLVMLLLYFSVMNSATASRDVSGKRECSTCHIMWLTDFDRKDVTPLIPYDPKPVVETGKQDVSSTNKMCFSCHDGFVLDSRSVWKSEKHNHPVGMKPSRKIKIPTSKGKTVFPLNDDGKVYCGTCHTAHGVDWNQEESPVFLRVKNVESSMCLACHLEKSTGPEEGNHPIFKKPPNKPGKLVKAGAMFAKDGGVICQSCHSPHASDNENILLLHNRESNLCLSCHKDKSTVNKTKHNLQKSAPGAKNSKKQTTSQSGICGSCHIPHGARGPMLWARNLQQGTDKAAERCLSCHNKDGLAKDKTVGIHSHPTKVSIKHLGIKPGKDKWQYMGEDIAGEGHQALPLYNNSGHKSKKAENISCGSCHDPHTWSANGIEPNTADGELVEGDENSSFLRIAQESRSLLCLNCHLKNADITKSRHNMFNNADIPKEQVLKGGICEQCHLPHNGKGKFMRAREGGNEKDSSVMRMCIACHSKDGIAKNKAVDMEYSHPVGVGTDNLPQARKNLPLFTKEGEKDPLHGKVDCATCHNAHSWVAKITSYVDPLKEGDASTSFLRISASHKSELCMECHADKNTVVGTDHDLLNNDAVSTDHKDGGAIHSGVCGQCHSVHNATMKTVLWAREPAKVNSQVEKMCLSCHARGKVAENKVPPKLTHPDHVTVWSNNVREKRLTNKLLPDIPVYNNSGKQAHVGLITCLSCHDPHQWQPGKKQPGSGRNIEGDAMTSFLRNANTELIICADCHGADAIFRYKYFHGETSRKKYPLYQ